MNETQTEISCRHPLCKCPRRSTGDYCGDYCENAHRDQTPELICECGHTECRT